MAPTPKRGLPQPAGTDLISGGDDAIKAGFLTLDDAMFWSSGTLAARPAASTAKAATAYLSTDTSPPRIDISDGTNWRRVYPLDDLEVTAAKTALAVQQSLFATGDYKYSLQAANHGDLGGGVYAWLLADGTETPAVYTALIALLNAKGNPFGVGAGGRPLLPNLIERVPVMPGAASGRTTRTLGASGGEETHTLTINEIPAHNHGGATGTESADHTHSGATAAEASDHTHTSYDRGRVDIQQGTAGAWIAVSGWGGLVALSATTGRSAAHAHSFTTGGRSAAHTHAVSSQGGGLAHNVMPPYLVGGSWFVRT